MPQRSATRHNAWFPRSRASVAPVEPFVPVRGSVEAVRQVFAHFDAGNRVVVLYGPGGSGRSAIARRTGSLWPGPVSFLNAPSADSGPAVLFRDDPPQRGAARSRGETLRVVDALTLDHAGWSSFDPQILPARQRLLVVASTAWWLEFGRFWPVRVAGVATRRIEPDEIAHLMNALRWMKHPAATPVDPAFVAAVAEKTDGLIAEVVRMAG
jgi:hypothetical protein